jgi:hypothetical protein
MYVFVLLIVADQAFPKDMAEQEQIMYCSNGEKYEITCKAATVCLWA